MIKSSFTSKLLKYGVIILLLYVIYHLAPITCHTIIYDILYSVQLLLQDIINWLQAL